jgi:enoyl-CoA hydratase/carnithine racemase
VADGVESSGPVDGTGPVVRSSHAAGVARITIDRPERRNAMSSAMWQALPRIAHELESREDVRVVLMRGAGGAAFSAGADIAEMQAQLAEPEALRITQGAVQIAQDAWARLDRPTIALICGACTGGGCGLALACDLRIATPESFFAIPPAKLGLVYSLIDTRRVVDQVGPSRAKEILFTGRRFAAAEALEWGMLNRIVAAAQLEAEGRALALEIASCVQSSVRASKRIINAIAGGATAETEESQRLYSESFWSPEFKAATAAFLARNGNR